MKTMTVTLTIKAKDVRVGDQFVVPETGARGPAITQINRLPADGIELWNESDPEGMPSYLQGHWKVEVHRTI